MTVRIKQTGIAKNSNDKNQVYHLIGIYQLKDEKINHIWMEFNPTFNYFEKI